MIGYKWFNSPDSISPLEHAKKKVDPNITARFSLWELRFSTPMQCAFELFRVQSERPWFPYLPTLPKHSLLLRSDFEALSTKQAGRQASGFTLGVKESTPVVFTTVT